MLTLEQKDRRLGDKHQRTIFSGLNEDTDLLVAALGELGWTTKAIAARAGLSEGQVQYRLKFAEVKRADYRNGQSQSAALVERAVFGSLEAIVEKRVHKKLDHEQREKFSSGYVANGKVKHARGHQR